MNRALTATASALAVAAAVAVPLNAAADGRSDAPVHQGAPQRYAIQVQNLTKPGSQPLSPPLLVVHGAGTHLWGVGEIATHPVAAIAEDANNGPALQVFPQLSGVSSVAVGVDRGATAPAPIAPGATQTFTVHAGAGQRLSLLSMLVNTNDGFTGLDGLRMGDRSVTVYTNAYDAGSERNNQLAAYIPGPAGGHPFARDPEGALIRMHPGILTGVGDLSPEVYGWKGAVAKITVTPMR